MRNAGLDETQAGIKISGRNINNLRYADDTTLMTESEELKCWDQPNNKPTSGSGTAEESGKIRLRNKVGIRELMLLAGKGSDLNPCLLFIANIYFLIPALAISVLYSLRWGIKIYNAQS